MGRRLPLAGLLLPLLGGCGEPTVRNADQRAVELILATERVRRSMDPCVIQEGHQLTMRPYRDCLQLLPGARMRGVWFTGFEESGFIADVDSVPPEREIGPGANREFETFLEIDAAAALRRIGQPAMTRCTRAVAIEFIGRRSREPGPYYAGLRDHVVVVDRLLSARLLGTVATRNLPGYEDC